MQQHMILSLQQYLRTQEEVTEDEVKFDYKLYAGPATTRNAIKLLNVIGYDKNIIKGAEQRAMHFLTDGNWKS